MSTFNKLGQQSIAEEGMIGLRNKMCYRPLPLLINTRVSLFARVLGLWCCLAHVRHPCSRRPPISKINQVQRDRVDGMSSMWRSGDQVYIRAKKPNVKKKTHARRDWQPTRTLAIPVRASHLVVEHTWPCMSRVPILSGEKSPKSARFIRLARKKSRFSAVSMHDSADSPQKR
jgi:hypothetical protein